VGRGCGSVDGINSGCSEQGVSWYVCGVNSEARRWWRGGTRADTLMFCTHGQAMVFPVAQNLLATEKPSEWLASRIALMWRSSTSVRPSRTVPVR